MHHPNRRDALRCIGAAPLAIALSPHAVAQASDYPRAPIRIVIPTAPGGALDGTARMLADRLGAAMGQPVVVDNRAGGNGAIAYSLVAKAPPDGYTLVLSLSSLVLTSLMSRSPGYTLKELTPVSLAAMLPNGFAVSKEVPANDIRQFVEWARTQKNGVDYGTSGPGSSANILGEMFAQRAGIKMVHVPFKGEAPAIQAALGGQIAAVISATGTLSAQAKAGQMKMLAVALDKRLRDFPDVPTFVDAGYPDVSLSGWSVLAAPAGTPRPIVDRIATEVTRILQTDDVAARIHAYGFQPEGGTSAQAQQFMEREATRWAAAIKATGITME